MLRPWLAFRDLQAGERFRFLYGLDRNKVGGTIYIKRKGCWYEAEGGQRFKTGKWTAVRLEGTR